MQDDYTMFIADNIFLFGILTALAVMIVSTEMKRLLKKYRDITPAEAVQLINREGAVMLDVRESSELETGRVRNAKFLSASVLPKRMDELDDIRDKPIITFCAHGLKARNICQLLSKRGFPNIYFLKGGIAAWEQANLPLTKK
ncbi:MAG: rhodanese-like domain-containing protein [Gammaproteobacteria bacterium]|nr:rhodanese-like domain-containing protein [Gammaproteobacteria bacterium]MDD9808042.1 rhodanese-like domain-containing protein [Gammaproteobacteria bacterium]MDD9869888.1 rhodanese-like domain-containing protein [Gammaproteobacteria bacterium]